MNCLLAAVFAARSGMDPVDPRMVTPPPELDGRPRSYAEKGIFGSSFDHHVETENFTIQWTDPTLDPARVDEIGVALELAWTALVEEGGWTPPVSSDNYLLWVILDPTLAGSGYTTEYTAAEFPEGYPVTYLHPTIYADEYPDYALSVAAHEFGHMLQYAVADWDPSNGQTWYWEATAEWQAERAVPDIDTYALSSYWYARGPELSFDSVYNGHPYGMFVLNAYLDEHEFGLDGIRDVWEASGPPWDEVIAERAGRDFASIMHDFVGAYGAEALAESALYDRPITPERFDTVPTSERLNLPGRFGSVYIEVDDYDPAAGVAVSGPVDLVIVQDGAWDVEPEAGPVLFVVNALEEGQSFTFGTEPEAEPTDSGDPAGDSGRDPGEKPEPASCACDSRDGAASLSWIVALGVVVLRRPRRGAIVPHPPRSPLAAVPPRL